MILFHNGYSVFPILKNILKEINSSSARFHLPGIWTSPQEQARFCREARCRSLRPATAWSWLRQRFDPTSSGWRKHLFSLCRFVALQRTFEVSREPCQYVWQPQWACTYRCANFKSEDVSSKSRSAYFCEGAFRFTPVLLYSLNVLDQWTENKAVCESDHDLRLETCFAFSTSAQPFSRANHVSPNVNILSRCCFWATCTKRIRWEHTHSMFSWAAKRTTVKFNAAWTSPKCLKIDNFVSLILVFSSVVLSLQSFFWRQRSICSPTSDFVSRHEVPAVIRLRINW